MGEIGDRSWRGRITRRYRPDAQSFGIRGIAGGNREDVLNRSHSCQWFLHEYAEFQGKCPDKLPVYIDGKLVGALSLKFGVFVKEPLAGVTPIEDILSIPTGDSSNPKTLSVRSVAAGDTASPASITDLPHYPVPTKWAQAAGAFGDAFLEPIASPLVFSGVAPATLRQYSAEWAPYGMVAAAGGTAPPASDDAKVVPRDMVSILR